MSEVVNRPPNRKYPCFISCLRLNDTLCTFIPSLQVYFKTPAMTPVVKLLQPSTMNEMAHEYNTVTKHSY
jgi:hypothetical protein